MRRVKLVISICFVLAAVLVLAGCPPKFPNCKTDEHCKDAENNEGKAFCINGQCQECGKDEDCPAGKICKFNRCEVKPQCLADADCSGGMICKGQKCVPECTKDAECGSNMKCQGVRCVPAVECSADGDCKDGKVCDAGKCLTKAMAAATAKDCDIVTINFEFNSYEITAESKNILQKNAECIKQKGIKSLVIEGNCDERGTTEYNMSLGLNRANAAKKFLQNLGVKNIKSTSYGKERPVCTQSTEDCWYKNRRSDFSTK